MLPSDRACRSLKLDAGELHLQGRATFPVVKSENLTQDFEIVQSFHVCKLKLCMGELFLPN